MVSIFFSLVTGSAVSDMAQTRAVPLHHFAPGIVCSFSFHFISHFPGYIFFGILFFVSLFFLDRSPFAVGILGGILLLAHHTLGACGKGHHLLGLHTKNHDIGPA